MLRYRSMKGDYRTLDDSGFFLVSSMIIYVRGARHDQQSIPRTIPPLTFFFSTIPRCVLPLTLTKLKHRHCHLAVAPILTVCINVTKVLCILLQIIVFPQRKEIRFNKCNVKTFKPTDFSISKTINCEVINYVILNKFWESIFQFHTQYYRNAYFSTCQSKTIYMSRR